MPTRPFVIRLLHQTLANCCDRYHKYGLHKLHLAYVLIIYSLLGGLMFNYLESENQALRLEQKFVSTNRSRIKFLQELKSLYNSKMKFIDKNAYSLLESYEEENCPLSIADKAQWDFWASVYYCITIFTTIGYGNNAPVTTVGRAMTIIYAMIGVPLLLALLSHVGQVWGCWLRTADARLRPIIARWCENIRAKKSGERRRESQIIAKCPRAKFDIIIPVIGFLLLFGWLLLSSTVFYLLNKEHTFFEAFYFMFITFSTIGLGDVVPSNPRRMFWAFPLIIVGLSLVSLCHNLLKYQIEKMDDKTEDNCLLDHEAGAMLIDKACVKLDCMIRKLSALPADFEEIERYQMDNGDSKNQEQLKHSIFDQVALGALQAVIINARYAEIGVQTDESYAKNL